MYQRNRDPWKFASSEYELKRYQNIYTLLRHKRYQSIFEPGCSIGVLTKKLAFLGNEIRGVDISPTAISIAQHRCAHLKNVFFECQALENCTINNKTDLIVLSEIGYYFHATEWMNIIERLVANSSPKLMILASHWLGVSQDHCMAGDEVHHIINSIKGLSCEYSQRTLNFRLDRWVKQ
jgi:2-polyprenyl-3-methyl-5-hydroxy-6-metoxy-1,4-benzoquinol methylase